MLEAVVARVVPTLRTLAVAISSNVVYIADTTVYEEFGCRHPPTTIEGVVLDNVQVEGEDAVQCEVVLDTILRLSITQHLVSNNTGNLVNLPLEQPPHLLTSRDDGGLGGDVL